MYLSMNTTTEQNTTQSSSVVELKGSTFTMSVLHIKTTHIPSIVASLEQKAAQAPQFFIGLPLVLELSAIAHNNIDLKQLKSELSLRHFVVVGIIKSSNMMNQQAKSIGIATLTHKAVNQKPVMQAKPRGTKVVHKNIRSGQQIYAAQSDLVIFGSVSNGAEVIADGSIHIYGTLRGKAMAGAEGNASSCIITQSLEAELISIAGQYWLSESLLQYEQIGKSCCVALNGESLSLTPFNL